MQAFLDNARSFPQRIAQRGWNLGNFAHGQRPLALFITCSDSRVVPTLFTGARPGELFELRVAGNIVPRYRPQAASGIAATLEYAVTALHVPDIVVCSHSHCGAVQGLMHPRHMTFLPLLAKWLDLAGHGTRAASELPIARQAARASRTGRTDPDTMAQLHTLIQLGNIRSYPFVARRITAGKLRLHGWFYAVETGQVYVERPGSCRFQPL
ncbi:carbonic anhydrase [Streptomyces sp. NPDC090442]|uniref:carbonic anhydrase n=1 Tax=Streptomyces sp. NPDC090442 TaxID=3365962 RepID=UPI00382208D7